MQSDVELIVLSTVPTPPREWHIFYLPSGGCQGGVDVWRNPIRSLWGSSDVTQGRTRPNRASSSQMGTEPRPPLRASSMVRRAWFNGERLGTTAK